MNHAAHRPEGAVAEAMPVIEVEDLSVHFAVDEGTLKAVDQVSFAIKEQQMFGLIGESGCGKTVTAQSLMRLVPKPGRIVNGQINYRTERGHRLDLAEVDGTGSEIRSIRGKEIAMIFQEPMSSLSPIHSIGNQLMEAVLLHITRKKREAYEISAGDARSGWYSQSGAAHGRVSASFLRRDASACHDCHGAVLSPPPLDR